MRKSFAIVAAFIMLLGACTDDDAGTTSATTAAATTTTGSTRIPTLTAAFDPDQIQFVASLRQFDACADVLAYFKAAAMSRVGPYGLDGGGGYYPTPFAFEDSRDLATVEPTAGFGDDSAVTTTASAGFNEGSDFSGTNVQVVGVDEPDIIKTDGARILAFANQTLSYVDVSGGNARLLGTLYLPGWDHRFFMDGDKAIVFARGDEYSTPLPVARDASIAPYGGPKAVVFEVDLSDPEDLTVLRTMHIDGNYLSARSVDGVVRMVVSSYPAELPFVYPSSVAAEDLALETNQRVIEESTIEAWLPNFTLVAGTDGEVIDEGLLIDCGQVHGPAEFAGFDTLAVLSIENGLDSPVGAALVAQGETIYASSESLYVATNVWVPSDIWGTEVARRIEDTYSTAIHKFDITGAGAAEYVASGSVEGHLLNQFAMDEYMGNLRVATTNGPPWGFDDSSESFVTVLQVRDGELQQVGKVGEMGRGEQIFSVRFIGPRAYVVTFRQVDPFYVVDLSDPEAPRVAGELKIAGYSGYLHPVGENRILGIGQDATDEGFTTGAKATMFDVSDPSAPRELGTWTMDGGYSDVEWDHLAFLYWPPESMVVLPVQSWQEQFYGAVVLKTDDGVRELGRISHSSAGVAAASDCRVLTDDEILALGGEEPDLDIIVQVCAEDEIGGAGSFQCESLPFDDAVALGAEDGIDVTTIMAEGDRLEVCYPEFDSQDPQIVRSLVIGDQVWTLSWRSLQSNDIDDLSVGQLIPLG